MNIPSNTAIPQMQDLAFYNIGDYISPLTCATIIFSKTPGM